MLKKSFMLKAGIVGAAFLCGVGTIWAIANDKLEFVSADSCSTTTTYYLDQDGDTYGLLASTVQSCEMPAGYSATSTDCNDSNASINPGITEVCNGIDDDCDGYIDEGTASSTWYRDLDGDGFGYAASSTLACTQPSGYVATSTDCNDNNSSIHPFAAETCNGIDDNCNGVIDEGLTSTIYYRDLDGDNYGDPMSTTTACSQPSGYVTDNTDCNDNNSNVRPGISETCNGIDDNCSGVIDEGLTLVTFYRDADGDTYGNPSVYLSACSAPAGYVSNNSDCNDSDSSIHPGANEACDNINNDCDAYTDEGCGDNNHDDDDWQRADCTNTCFKNHGQKVSCWAHYTNWLKADGQISGKEKGEMMSQAAKDKFFNCGASAASTTIQQMISQKIQTQLDKLEQKKAKILEKMDAVEQKLLQKKNQATVPDCDNNGKKK